MWDAARDARALWTLPGLGGYVYALDWCPGDPATLAVRRTPPPPSRTNWTCRVLHPVLIGHAVSLIPY